MKTTAWIALALTCLSCGPGAPPPVVGPTVVIAPISTGTAAPAPTNGPEAAPDTTTDEEVRHLAKAALQRKADWGSASRLEIHAQFPHSKQVKDALVRAGAPWTEEDWFGADEPAPPARWEVAIGVEVDVEAAQAVIAACFLEGDVAVALLPMTEDEEFGNRRRIYVGPLDARPGGTTPPVRIRALLTPGISKERFYSLPGGKGEE